MGEGGTFAYGETRTKTIMRTKTITKAKAEGKTLGDGGLLGINPLGELECAYSLFEVVAVSLDSCHLSFVVDFAYRYDGVVDGTSHTDSVLAVHAADARLLFLCFL